MIAVDSSALLAVMLREPDGDLFRDALVRANGEAIASVAQILEVSIRLLHRFGEAGEAMLPALLGELKVGIADIDAEHLHEARAAYRRFGKGRHPAGLNFGDCFAYALSKTNNWPLLFKGDDFAKTDIEAAKV